jgi:hypothetical protein
VVLGDQNVGRAGGIEMALVAVVQFAAFRVGARGLSAWWSVDLILALFLLGDAFSLEKRSGILSSTIP